VLVVKQSMTESIAAAQYQTDVKIERAHSGERKKSDFCAASPSLSARMERFVGFSS
jgi:hypothetical protein